MARLSNETARATVGNLESLLRERIASGEYGPGQLLPSARELSRRQRVGPRSVRHALSALQQDGLVAAEPRRGFRVLRRSAAPVAGGAMAFVLPREEAGRLDAHNEALFAQLQRSAAEAGHPLLAVGGGDMTPAQAAEHLAAHRVRGAVVNAFDPELLGALRGLGIPLAAVDAWHPEMGIDTIIQDGFLGGRLAAEHLLARGHRRIAWVGRRNPRELGLLASDRLGGAASALIEAGVGLPAGMLLATEDLDSEAAERELAALLGGRERPTAVIALWVRAAALVARVARGLGLEPGKDLELVAWSSQEMAEGLAGAQDPGPYASAVVTWSMREMAETALKRIEQRRAAPEMPVTVSKLPVRLVPAAGGAER